MEGVDERQSTEAASGKPQAANGVSESCMAVSAMQYVRCTVRGVQHAICKAVGYEMKCEDKIEQLKDD